MKIEGTEYSAEMVEKFLETKGSNATGKNTVDDFPRHWFEQHLITFKQGYDLGCAHTEADAPDCDSCERINEEGPPPTHRSQDPNT